MDLKILNCREHKLFKNKISAAIILRLPCFVILKIKAKLWKKASKQRVVPLYCTLYSTTQGYIDIF